MFQLLNRDCIDLSDIKDVRLCYIDPPYSHKGEDIFYGVGDTFDQYLSFIKERLFSIQKVMDPKGFNLLVHLDFKAHAYVRVIADEIFGRNNFRNEIIWCYTGPSSVKSHLPRKHDVILNYSVNDYAFNQEFIPYKENLRVGGKTAWKQDMNVQEYLDKGKKLEDYWTDIPALVRNENEKLGYKTQKPLKLMERIVKMFSNPNDLVMDAFCGSGSFLEAAIKNDRNAIGVDINPEAIEICKKRLERYELVQK